MINSRKKGIVYEQKLVREFKELLSTENIYSSRAESKRMDDLGVDIVGEIPIHVQAKAVETCPQLHEILKNMPKDKPRTIFWKRNNKTELVIMEKQEFYDLLLTITKK